MAIAGGDEANVYLGSDSASRLLQQKLQCSSNPQTTPLFASLLRFVNQSVTFSNYR